MSVVKNSAFFNTHNQGDGGAINYDIGSYLYINSCFFFDVNTTGNGGCISLTSGKLNISNSCFSICCSTTFGNNIKYGNAIYAAGSYFTLIDCYTYKCAPVDGCDSSIKTKSESYVNSFNSSYNHGDGGGSSISLNCWGCDVKYLNSICGTDSYCIESMNVGNQVANSNFIEVAN